MATYVLLTTLTPEGRQTLHKNPDRLVEVNKEVEQFRLQSHRPVRGFRFIRFRECRGSAG